MRFAVVLSMVGNEWCVSPLVRMECRIRALAQSDARRLTEVEAILSTMTRLDLTDAVFDRAAELRAQTGLKTPDALHVATALEHGCAEPWAADARLAKATAPGFAVRVVA